MIFVIERSSQLFKKEGGIQMRKKIIVTSIVFAVLLIAMVAANSLMNQGRMDSPVADESYKGTMVLNLTLSNGSYINNAVVNVTFRFTLNTTNANETYVYNTTVHNSSANQSFFQNTSIDTTLIADGYYNISVVIQNLTGGLNSSNNTFAENIIIDNSAPSVSNGSFTALNSSDVPLFNYSSHNRTLRANVSDLSIYGVIFLFDNATGNDFNVSQVNVYNTSGIWTTNYNMSTLHPGFHTVTVYANDTAGNINRDATFSFNVNSAQVINFTASANITATTRTEINFTTGVIGFNISINVTTTSNILPIWSVFFGFNNASGNSFNSSNVTMGIEGTPSDVWDGNFWNITFDVGSLVEGYHNLTIFVNDSVGNYNNTEYMSFWVDRTGPSVTNYNMSEEGTANLTDTTITFNFSSGNRTFRANISDTIRDIGEVIRDVSSVYVLFDNATGNVFNLSTANDGQETAAAFNTSGIWTMSYNLSALHPGVHTITFFANDTLDNVNRSETITFTVNTAPVVDFSVANTSRFNGSSADGKNFTSGSGDININVTVTNSTGRSIGNVTFMFDNASGNDFNRTAVTMWSMGKPIGTEGQWNVSVDSNSLAEGTHFVTLFANDSVGNYNATESITFLVDRSAPAITVTCTSSPTVGSTVTCTCTASDTNPIKNAAVFEGDAENDATSTATAESTGTKYSPYCTATDFSGNIGRTRGSYSVVEASSSGGGGSGGSGGGSSSGISGLSEKKVWTSIKAGESASVSVKNGAIGVTEVSFDVSKIAYGAWVQVKKRDSFPSTVKSFAKKTYRKIEITKSSTLKDEILSNRDVFFKVEKTWLSTNNLNKEDVSLYRYVDGEWTELATKVGVDDGTYVRYSAQTPGFSYFLIGEKSGEVVPEVTKEGVAEGAAEGAEPSAPAAEGAAVEGEAVTGEEVSEGSTWPWIVAVIVILLAGVLYWWLRRN